MTTIRTIIEESRTIGSYQYQVSLTYYSDRKEFHVGAVPLEESITPGFTCISMSDMMAIKRVRLPIAVSRFSKKAEAEARGMFEEHLTPILKQCFELKLSQLQVKDFGPDGHMRRTFTATCNLIEEGLTYKAERPELPQQGWAKPTIEIDGARTRLFLQLVWKGEDDRPWECDRYVYLVSIERSSDWTLEGAMQKVINANKS